jgi:serine/threonine protein kinase
VGRDNRGQDTSASYCTRCGARIAPGGHFCPRCGTGIAVAPANATATVATVPTPHRAGAAEPSTLLDALRHATLGEYEILAELGRGGMATVYLAHDLALDRKVAIKVLAPALLLGEGMVERFKREARTAAALSHPHIIPIYAVKQSDRVLYFVMKYVAGRALDSIVRDVGPLPIPMVQTILAHVSDALSYAHRHGVVHRDIKSANIMLDEEGWAVVTDFGIAKVLQAEGLTMTGVTVGTPTYMSPEQCATREVTGASDQYSLGVVAYEMLAGRLPLRGDSIMAVMYAHFNERPRAVTELRSDCPPKLAAAVMRMLEKDPAARWPSMDDVVANCAGPSLHHDDPIRSEMITLAKAGGHSQLLAQLKTPTSPIPPAKAPMRPPAPVPGARRASAVGWALAGVVIGATLWWAVPWRSWLASPPPPAPTRDIVPIVPAVEAPRVAVDTAPVRRPPEPVSTRAPRQRSLPRGTAAPSAAALESTARAASARREDSLVRSLRATALGAMSRAVQAGATPAELAKGDTVFRGADSLATQGRMSEAMVQLATAASLWADVERLSRSRAVRDTPRQPAAEPSAPLPAAAPPDPRPQIEQVIAEYAHALESRDLGEVRRAYPGLTAAQQDGWREFFRSVRRLKAGLTVTAVRVVGATAEAIVSGVYEYENATTGRSERRPVTFRAILAAEPSGWRLTAIR